MARARQISSENADPDAPAEEFEREPVLEDDPISVQPTPATSGRVGVRQSPYIYSFYGQHPLKLTLDTGAEINIRAAVAKYIGAKITKSAQNALQADGRTPLSVYR